MKGLLMAATLAVSFVAWAQSGGTPSSDPTAPSSSSSSMAHNAYNIEGKVTKFDKGSVTLERAGLPEAELNIKDKTIVVLDGHRVATASIPEGSMVRAQFQLEGDKPVALRMIVASPSGSSPSNASPDQQGASDTSKSSGEATTPPKN